MSLGASEQLVQLFHLLARVQTVAAGVVRGVDDDGPCAWA